MVTSALLARFLGTLARWDFLHSLPLSVPPLYLALTGLAWSLIGLPLAWGLWRGEPRAATGLRWLAPIFVLYHWLDRIVLVDGAAARVNWPFRVTAALIGLALFFWILSRPKARAYFGEWND